MSSELRNEFAFSFSKAKLLEECERAFWYTVYRSWGGWYSNNRPPESAQAEAAYKAKHFTNVPELAGSVVHEVAAWGLQRALESPEIWSDGSLRLTLLKRAAAKIDDCIESAMKRLGTNPKRITRLVELENGLAFHEDELRDLVRHKLTVLTAGNDSWDGDLKAVNPYLHAISIIDRVMLIEEFTTHHLAIGSDVVKVFFTIDLALKSVTGKGVVIVDWKTGRPRQKDAGQITSYAALMGARNFDSVTPILAYVSGDIGRTVKVPWHREDSMASLMADVSLFVEKMRPKLVGGDLHLNKAIESEFHPTADYSKCERCRFMKVCRASGAMPTKPSPLP